jgi:hypothetical protein
LPPFRPAAAHPEEAARALARSPTAALRWGAAEYVIPGAPSGPVALEASPLAQVYDETVGQLLEVLAEKERLQGRVVMLERQVQCKDEQLQLFARWAGWGMAPPCSSKHLPRATLLLLF